MRKSLALFGTVAAVALLAGGCAGPEKKLGRGMNNVGEAVRMGDMRRSVEQAGIWGGPSARAGGFFTGFNKSMARIGIGIYEVVTFPIPSYDPIATNYITPNPVWPESYQPGLPADPLYETDTSLGYSGGEVVPIVPGSRFAVFRTP